MIAYPVAFLPSRSGQVTRTDALSWPALAELVTRHEVGEKDGPAWMPAIIEPGPRKAERVRACTAVCLDVEASAEVGPEGKRITGPMPPALSDLAAEVALFGWRAALATSHSHGGELGPRYRVVLPVDRPMQPDEVRAVALQAAALLGLAGCVDAACAEPARLFYLPRHPAERAHLAERVVIEGAPLPVDALLTAARALHAPAPRRSPHSGSVIEAFNAQADLAGLLERHGYKPRGGGRYLWAGSTSGQPGVMLLPERGRVFSAHAQDPLHAEGRAHDAFSAWAALEHGGDTARAVREAARLLRMDRQREAPSVPAHFQDEAEGSTAEPAAPWKVVPLDDLDNAELPPQESAFGNYLPRGTLAVMAAHGGTLKSTVAAMIGVAVAVGVPLFGIPTQASPVVIFSAEDDGKVMRRRLQKILRCMGLPASALAGRLLVLDATSAGELAAVMATQGDHGQRGPIGMGLTTAGAALRDLLASMDRPVLIVDNASDTFPGNEIARRDVRQFVQLLVQMVRPRDGAVLLIAHVDKASARGLSTETYSGSTAWHNSARSRIALKREADGALLMTHEKAQFSAPHEPLRLTVVDGIPTLEEAPGGIVGHIARRADTAAVLRLIEEFTARGEFVSTKTTSRTHAGKLLRPSPGFPARLPDPELFELLREAERRQLLERVSYPGPDRHPRERWGLTPAGREAAGLPPAVTAVTAATTEVPAPGAVPAEPAATAATSPPGGVGGTAAADESPHSPQAEVLA